MLKTVFLGGRGLPGDARALRASSAPRLRSRPRRGTGDAEPRARSSTGCCADNYVMLGMLRYHVRPRRRAAAEDQTSALGVFNDPALLPVVFPGLMEARAGAPAPGRRATSASSTSTTAPTPRPSITSSRSTTSSSASGAPDGTLAAATLLLGRLAKGALTAKPQDVPLLREKLAWLLEHSGAASNSHAYRETRALFNHFPRRELLYADAPSLKTIIDRMVYMSGDDEIVVTTRQGAGYDAVPIAFSDLRYSHKARRGSEGGARRGVRARSRSTPGPTCGVIALLRLLLRRARRSSIRSTSTRCATSPSASISTWEDRVARHPRADLRPARRPPPVHALRPHRDAQRPVSRVDAARGSAGGSRRASRRSRRSSRPSVRADTAESATLKIYSPRPLGLTDDAAHAARTWRCRCARRWRSRSTLPDGRAHPSRAAASRGRRRRSSRRWSRARTACATRCARCRKSRATDDPLNGLVLHRRPRLARGRGAAHAAQPPAADPPGATTPRPSTACCCATAARPPRSIAPFAARFDPAFQGRREAAIEHGDDARAQRAARGRQPVRRRDPARRSRTWCSATVRTNAYQRPERPVFAIKVESAQRRRHGVAAAAVRDLRPLAQARRHPPARRQGRARRPALERSARRLPHRDPRPDEDADGQERHHRPGRLEGRLRAEGPAAAAAGARRVPDRALPRVRLRACSTSPTTWSDGEVVHPPEVVRHDDDDPYLVVAADKGTAHLSDTANQVSAQYGFWLGDAFASGGSNGYDHKKEGHHGARRVGVRHATTSATLGVDVQTQPFTMRRHRRHGRRRVRQRRAAQPDDAARRGLQSPAHLPRPDARSREELRRARAAVHAAALDVEGLRRGAHQRGRRHLRALGEGDSAQRRSARAARHRGRGAERRGGDPRTS